MSSALQSPFVESPLLQQMPYSSDSYSSQLTNSSSICWIPGGDPKSGGGSRYHPCMCVQVRPEKSVYEAGRHIS